MITREEAVLRLEKVAKEIAELKAAIEEGWNEVPVEDPTQAFLEKCGGWEDNRSPEDIIADIYAARTTSNTRTTIFNGESL